MGRVKELWERMVGTHPYYLTLLDVLQDKEGQEYKDVVKLFVGKEIENEMELYECVRDNVGNRNFTRIIVKEILKNGYVVGTVEQVAVAYVNKHPYLKYKTKNIITEILKENMEYYGGEIGIEGLYGEQGGDVNHIKIVLNEVKRLPLNDIQAKTITNALNRLYAKESNQKEKFSILELIRNEHKDTEKYKEDITKILEGKFQLQIKKYERNKGGICRLRGEPPNCLEKQTS